MKRFFALVFGVLATLSLSAQTAEKVTFRGVLALVQSVTEDVMPAPKDVVEASGLRLVYYSCYDEGEFDSSAFYYTRNANVTGEYDEERLYRKAEKTAGHACVLGLEFSSSCGGEIRFSTKEDYDRFFREAVAYGLLQEKDNDRQQYFINATPLNVGKVLTLTNEEIFAGVLSEDPNPKYTPQYMLVPEGKNDDGWHTYRIAIDF